MTQCYHPPFLDLSLTLHGALDSLTHAVMKLNELAHDTRKHGFIDVERAYISHVLAPRLEELKSVYRVWAPPPPDPKPMRPARPGHVLDVRDSLFALCDQFDALLIPPEGKAYAENQLAVMLERLKASQLRLQQLDAPRAEGTSQVPE